MIILWFVTMSPLPPHYTSAICSCKYITLLAMTQCLLLSLLAPEQAFHIKYDILYVNEIWPAFESVTMGVVCVPSRCCINYILSQSSNYDIM